MKRLKTLVLLSLLCIGLFSWFTIHIPTVSAGWNKVFEDNFDTKNNWNFTDDSYHIDIIGPNGHYDSLGGYYGYRSSPYALALGTSGTQKGGRARCNEPKVSNLTDGYIIAYMNINSSHTSANYILGYGATTFGDWHGIGVFEDALWVMYQRLNESFYLKRVDFNETLSAGWWGFKLQFDLNSTSHYNQETFIYNGSWISIDIYNWNTPYPIPNDGTAIIGKLGAMAVMFTLYDDVEIGLDAYIIGEEIEINNPSCGTWLFAEHKYYTFEANFSLYRFAVFDTMFFSFLDFASNNITIFYNAADEEAGVSIGNPYVSVVTDNATFTYISGNASSVNKQVMIRVSVWIKYNIYDTFDVDLYFWGNTTSASDGEDTGWLLGQEDYFNIYSKGGLESLTVSGVAGRTMGGDFWNLYAYNNSEALSVMYWRGLVHLKVLFEIKWDHGSYSGLPWEPPSQDFPDFHFQLGWMYYARGNWCVNNDMWVDFRLNSFGWGANHQFSRWTYTVMISGDTVYQDYIMGWFDDEADSYKVWIDLWFNKANASSLCGTRSGSYWFGVYNNADWIHRVFTGNDWGVYYENITTHLAFHLLEDENQERLFSSEIELLQLRCKIAQYPTAYNYSAEIWKIHVFDLTFDAGMNGIPTPPFEPPKTPNMPIGGFLGVIYSALMWLADTMGPGVMQFWYVFVAALDGTIGAWLGQPTFFTWFFAQIGLFFDYMINSVAYYLSIMAGFFILLGATIGKFAGLVGNAFQTWADMFTTVIDFLDTGFNSGINVWNDLGMSWWLLIGLILYPIYLLSIWENDGIEALMAHIMFIVNIFAFLANILLRVAQFGINIIHYIIEAIPVVE